MMQRVRWPQAAFTLIELMIVVAVAAVVLVLAAPSFRELIEMQRLRSVNAQLVTDLQFARAEAVSRQMPVVLKLGTVAGSLSCYTVYACKDSAFAVANCNCSCASGAGNACIANANVREIRTVVIPSSTGVEVGRPPSMPSTPEVRFDPQTGAVIPVRAFTDVGWVTLPWSGAVDTRLIRNANVSLRTMIGLSGRPSVCAPLTAISGFESACAANN
ncbi:MAG: GspH/FimT family pseudopilin [Burkholderiaceae bacterium]|jgi:type IV fimbrial biogenesis protein FimT|nr:GspH/FimT family pseudopilin [Burkholderiaceae bacterium]